MKNVFEATLRNRSQPKLGALAVTFPIPEERYENVILALQNLQIGDVRKQDCCIESIRAPDCPALLRMTNTMANVDELDWLGKQLESFDRYELLQFNAAVERFGLSAQKLARFVRLQVKNTPTMWMPTATANVTTAAQRSA